MNILLVGASGFIGSHLLEALSAAGHRVIATSRSGWGPLLPEVEWLPLDLARLADEPDYFAWPDAVDLVINATGLFSADAEAMARAQDRGPRALFKRAALHGAGVLQISALGAGSQPEVPFLASKAAADDYLLGLGIPAVVLRPSLVIGPGGASSVWLTRLSPWPLIPLLDRQARTRPLHVADLAAAVLALLRHWPDSGVLPLVGAESMTQGDLLDRLRVAQGWAPGRYLQVPAPLARLGAWLGDRCGWRALNSQLLRLARTDNLASAEPLGKACGYRAAFLSSRLRDWPKRADSLAAVGRPLLLGSLAAVWLGTALVCLGPGREWGVRIMAELGVAAGPGAWAVIAGAVLDGLLGVGMLLRRWRRPVLLAQMALMLGYTLAIGILLPHYWFDPYMAVGKNLVLLAASAWLYGLEPSARNTPK
ncbi:SDR family oxidoreductase [Pseudomonas sp. RIT-PI-AD]|uniref:SDR family oxidoreductase n=1 Tax=Pseudomonas sp. RIT-PI-AD TaxID=3035294 RepID=UPI0021D7F79D|nr:SDR family oxidoreductase [Pseudomonas sp. RIT-PI-AD]